MDKITATIETTELDWKAFQKHSQKTANAAAKSPWWHGATHGLFAVVIMFFYFRFFEEFHLPTAGVVLILLAAIGVTAVVAYQKARTAFLPDPSGLFIGRHEYSFDAEGLHSHGRDYQQDIRWAAIKRIEQTDDHILLYTDSFQALILPKRCLDNAGEFYEQLRSFGGLDQNSSGASESNEKV